jgi:hypothetical protein
MHIEAMEARVTAYFLERLGQIDPVQRVFEECERLDRERAEATAELAELIAAENEPDDEDAPAMYEPEYA